MRSWEEVHRLHAENRSGREIARTLGISRNTVSRLLAMPGPPAYGRTRRSRLEPYRATIISLLRQDKSMPATIIYRRLAGLGYDGGLTAVRDFVAKIRHQVAGTVNVARSPGGLQEEPGPEPGMNLISVDFDIMMVNRPNERLFRKPMLELLGKKCYREFERRDDVCPHCPGVAALVTGHPHRVESRGIRDDGTKYAVRLTAHPIMGPHGDPVGFVEVEEDITERKRSEMLAELVEDLEASLAVTHDVAGATRQALNVAFSLEGVEFGRAYIRDPAEGGFRAIAQRGVSGNPAATLVEEAMSFEGRRGSGRTRDQRGSVVRVISDGQAAVEAVPILHDGAAVAMLVLGSSTYNEFPLATHAALEALGRIVGSAVANLQALQLQRDTRADVEHLLGCLPAAAWCNDAGGKVTYWNRAAERLFGWMAAEVQGLDFPLELHPAVSADLVECSARDGSPLTMRLTTVAPPRVLGPQCQTLTIAVEMPVAPATPLVAGPKPEVVPPEKTQRPHTHGRILLVERDPVTARRLARILRRAGCAVAVCQDGNTANSRYQAAAQSARPYGLVIMELLPAGGMSGLDLASAIHRLNPQTRVVLTADSDIIGFESYGLAGALRKPYDWTLVCGTVMDLLEGSSPDDPCPPCAEQPART
ncbi:MAG: PAS domain S-box protein [Actinobacteria bacterium]|nr:PAS domain S-box protein [Actinomycetota bacterium]